MEWIEINYKNGHKIVIRVNEIEKISYSNYDEFVRIYVRIKEGWNDIEITEEEYVRLKNILTTKESEMK